MTRELPSPGQSDEEEAAQSQHSRRQTQDPGIPTRDEILKMINRLPGLILSKSISRADAKLILQILQTLLKTQTLRPEAENQREVSIEALADALRRDPTLQDTLAPFLSRAQIDAILRQNSDAPQ